MKLEVGMYVRTDNGIMKVNNIYQDGRENMDRFENKDGNIYFLNEIIGEPSFNIIDLIEVGDYVNGLPVRFIEESRVDIGQAEDYFWLKNQHIKSIVTHEQMEQMEYKVGE